MILKWVVHVSADSEDGQRKDQQIHVEVPVLSLRDFFPSSGHVVASLAMSKGKLPGQLLMCSMVVASRLGQLPGTTPDSWSRWHPIETSCEIVTPVLTCMDLLQKSVAWVWIAQCVAAIIVQSCRVFLLPYFCQASVRAAAATALAHLGEAGVGAFAEVLEQKMPSKDEEGSSRALETAAALYGFTHCSDELCCSKVDLILQRLDDPCKRVQLAAANTLKSLGPLCADSIAQKLKVEDPEERELFVIALGCIGSPNALPYTNMLVALLDSKNETSASVQVAAAEALAKCGPETGHAAAVALAELLSREGEDGQRKVAAAKNALISLKEVAAEVLPGLLSHKNPDVKCATFDILTSLGDGSGVLKELAACTSDANEKVRQQAVQALLLLKDPSVPLQILPRMMDDSDPTVAKLAISTIGKIGPRAVSLASVVAKQLKSTETDQRRAAACALGQLGELPSSTLKAIITQLRSEKNDEVKSALIQAIGSQGRGKKTVNKNMQKLCGQGSTLVSCFYWFIGSLSHDYQDLELEPLCPLWVLNSRRGSRYRTGNDWKLLKTMMVNDSDLYIHILHYVDLFIGYIE